MGPSYLKRCAICKQWTLVWTHTPDMFRGFAASLGIIVSWGCRLWPHKNSPFCRGHITGHRSAGQQVSRFIELRGSYRWRDIALSECRCDVDVDAMSMSRCPLLSLSDGLRCVRSVSGGSCCWCCWLLISERSAAQAIVISWKSSPSARASA